MRNKTQIALIYQSGTRLQQFIEKILAPNSKPKVRDLLWKNSKTRTALTI